MHFRKTTWLLKFFDENGQYCHHFWTWHISLWHFWWQVSHGLNNMPLYAFWQNSGVCSWTSTFIIQFESDIAVSPWNEKCSKFILIISIFLSQWEESISNLNNLIGWEKSKGRMSIYEAHSSISNIKYYSKL